MEVTAQDRDRWSRVSMDYALLGMTRRKSSKSEIRVFLIDLCISIHRCSGSAPNVIRINGNGDGH